MDKKIHIVWIVNDRYTNNFITVYRECQNNPRFAITIVAVPHLSAGISKEILSDEIYQFLISEGIDCINSWDQEKKEFIDISILKPDYIFTTTPYDIYLPEEYHSNNLMKISKLCNVYYGARIQKPEGMYSNIMENPYYSNCWRVFTNCVEVDTSPEKFIPIGYLKLDDYLHYNRNFTGDSKWKPRSAGNKPLRVVWKPRWTGATDDSNLLKYVGDFYSYVKDNKEIEFVFLAHPLLASTAQFKGFGDTYNEYMELFSKLANFRVENGSDFLDCVLGADVLIADHSSTIAEFAITGKPIIYTKTGAQLNELGLKIMSSAYQADSFKEISDVLNALIDGIDPLKEQRESKKDSYYTIPPRNMSVAQFLLEVLYNDFNDLDSHRQYARTLLYLARGEKKQIQLANIDLEQRIQMLDQYNKSLEQDKKVLEDEMKSLEANAKSLREENKILEAIIKSLEEDKEMKLNALYQKKSCL